MVIVDLVSSECHYCILNIFEEIPSIKRDSSSYFTPFLPHFSSSSQLSQKERLSGYVVIDIFEDVTDSLQGCCRCCDVLASRYFTTRNLLHDVMDRLILPFLPEYLPSADLISAVRSATHCLFPS